jgi:hypothetical protein
LQAVALRAPAERETGPSSELRRYYKASAERSEESHKKIRQLYVQKIQAQLGALSRSKMTQLLTSGVPDELRKAVFAKIQT